MKKYVVIVDGYRAGEQFFDAYNAQDVECIHIKSKEYKEDGLFASLDPSRYVEQVLAEQDENGNYNIQKILESLEAYRKGENVIIGAIAGIDGGTQLADEISAGLKLKSSNGIEKSLARRDKHEMVQVINKTDPTLATVSHLKSNNLDEIYRFIAKNEYPVVLKPLNSGGTDNVFICKDAESVKKAYNSIMASDNVFEAKNNFALVQTYLRGREFMVNGVSCNGKYVCTDIWEYRKNTNDNGRPLYEYEDALPIEGEEQSQLINYVNKVLSALDVKYGVTHVEVMLTEDKGPVLVEMATRVCGCKKKALYETVYGINPFDMTVLAHLDEEKFNKKAESRSTTLLKHARHSDISSTLSGIIVEDPFKLYLEGPMKLASIFEASWPKVGSIIEKTQDLLTTAGTVIFVHEDPDVVKRDYETIKAIKFVVEKAIELVVEEKSIVSMAAKYFCGCFFQPKTAKPDVPENTVSPLIMER